MAVPSDDLRHRCLFLRARAEEIRMVAEFMHDPHSQRAMFGMAYAYEMMAHHLERTAMPVTALAAHSTNRAA